MAVFACSIRLNPIPIGGFTTSFLFSFSERFQIGRFYDATTGGPPSSLVSAIWRSKFFLSSSAKADTNPVAANPVLAFEQAGDTPNQGYTL